MNDQLHALLTSLDADDIRESDDRVYFEAFGKQRDVHKDFPLVLIVESSSYCNLVCVGCPHKDLTRRRGFIKWDLFTKIIDEAARYDVRTWLHFMGEPLMHPQIFDMIDYATQKNLSYFGMSTNGILLTERNRGRILDSGLTRFEISVDSLDPDLLGLLRPGGSPETIIANAHAFFEEKYARGRTHPVTSVSMRQMQENAHEVDSFVAHWKEILQPPDFVLAIAWNSWGGKEGVEHARYQAPSWRVPCLKLWNMAMVLQDGRMVTCDAMYDGQVVMGDVNEQSIHEIYNGETYRAMRQCHLDGRAADLDICNGCSDWYRELVLHDNLTAPAQQTLEEIRDVVASGKRQE
jgi:radical SAM protein with 4Fe4S-binding SPASM domain